MEVHDRPTRIVARVVLSDIAKGPAWPIKFPTKLQNLSESAAVSLGPTKASQAKGLNPNRVPRHTAGQLELSAPQFVERFNLKRLSDGTCEGPLRVAMHSRNRLGHANDAHPVADADVRDRQCRLVSAEFGCAEQQLSLPYHQTLAVVVRGSHVGDRLRLAACLRHERDDDAHRIERGEAEMDRRGALRVVAAARDHLS